MKHHARSRHPFLENFRHYQVPFLGGDSAPITDPSSDDPKAKNNSPSPSPSPGVTVGKGDSSRQTPIVGGGGSGNPSGPNLGGDSRNSDPSRPPVGGENTPPPAPPPTPHSASTSSPGTRPTQRSTTEGSSQNQSRESTYARFSPDLSSRISPEGAVFSRSEVVRLHQDLQILLSRAETPTRPLDSVNAALVVSAESSLHGLSSLITQSLAVINQNPVVLIQGALQGSLKNSTGSAWGVLSALIRTLGTHPAPIRGDVSPSKAPLNISNLNLSSSGPTWNETRQNFLGSLQVTLGSVSLISVLSPHQSLFKGLFQEMGLNLAQERGLWSDLLLLGKNNGTRPAPLLDNPGVLKNFIQGLSFMGESFGFRWLQPMLTPLLRALFGGLLLKGEVVSSERHSSLLDELGALMARKMRRFKRKDRKRINRADRVVAKDHSLPIDTHFHETEGSIFVEEEEGEKESEELVSLLWLPS